MDRPAHWDNVYRTKSETDLSWHQEEPTVSLALIRELAPHPARVIDVGGGSSILASRLLDAGIHHVTVLDIAEEAIEKAKARSTTDAVRIEWRVGDITQVDHLGRFDIWHDRAVFHFLTDPIERSKYISLAAKSIAPAGHLIVATFALDGPEKCSGLDVERYDGSRLADAFGPAFGLIREMREVHATPWGKPQPFTYAVFRRMV